MRHRKICVICDGVKTTEMNLIINLIFGLLSCVTGHLEEGHTSQENLGK